MKIKLLIIIMLASIGASAQSWTSFGTGAIQRRIVGSDTTYRWVGSSVGAYIYGRSEWAYKQIFAPIGSGTGYIQNQIATPQTANSWITGNYKSGASTNTTTQQPDGYYANTTNDAAYYGSNVAVIANAADNIKLQLFKNNFLFVKDGFAQTFRPYQGTLTGNSDFTLPNNGGVLATEENIGFVTPQMFGAKADGTTDDAVSMQAAIDFATANGKTLFIPAVGVYRMYASMKLKEKITIKSNGATLYSTPTNLSVKSFFELDSLASSDTDIEIDGINTIGLVEIKFIVNKSGGVASPRTPIKRISIKNIQSELQPITIDFNPEFIELRNITTGLNLTVSDLYTSAITISNDPTFTTGKTLIMDNCYVWGGYKDADMFFIKGESYEDIRLSNLTANSIGSIPSRSGDGFDMDGLGKNVVLENIRAINCGMEIKQGASIFSTYNLLANNLSVINPSNAGISLRAPGSYNNILVQNPVATGLAVTGYLPSDGSTQADNFINVNNVQLINAGSKAVSSGMMTIGSDNINMTNVSMFNEFGTTTPMTTAIRMSSSKTVSLSNFIIKDAINAITIASSSVIEDLSMNSFRFNNVTAKVLNISATSVTNMSVNDLKFNNFTGSAAIGLGSTTYSNIRFNDFPNTVVHQMIGTTAFITVSPNFLLNNVLYDRTVASGALPTLNAAFPVGHIAQNVADGKEYIRVSTSATPSVAFSAINNGASTGTGNIVLATAPTLSNPVVGTQAAADNTTKAASTAYVTSAITAISNIIDATGTPYSSATLNSTYPNVAVGVSVYCRNAGFVYTKQTEAGSSDVWVSAVITIVP